MRRAAYLAAALTFLSAASPATADTPAKIARVGVLWPGSAAALTVRMEPYRQALRDHGFVEGRNVVFELRHADGRTERLPQLAAELVRLDVDVISAFGTRAIRLVQQASKKIPIVGLSEDFLEGGLVTSLARPGGNTTGVSLLTRELNVKRLGLLKELLPDISRIAVLWDPATGTSQLKEIQAVARSLAVELLVLEVRSPNDLATAFRLAKERRAEALNVLASPLITSLQGTIVDNAVRDRLPTMTFFPVGRRRQAGGLISYGPDILTIWQQIGGLVGRVLKGAKPADLPVEQPSRFTLAVDLGTAKALGIAIPQSILLRADEVIE